MDLWRPYKDADKVYVMVELPDKSQELFLVDTGASISVLNEEVAERLKLNTQNTGGMIQGLGGSVPWIQTTVSSLKIGDFTLEAVDMAVGVPGVPDRAGALPVAGILGNNVWGNFVLVVDYPADVLELHLQHAYRIPKKSAPLLFDGYQALTPIYIEAQKDNQRVSDALFLEVDTGAHDLLIAGRTGEAYRDITTLGLEPILGVGADLDSLPESEFLQQTRRIPVSSIEFASRRLDYQTSARWVGSDGPSNRPNNLSGLIGYQVFRDYRLVLDFPGQHILLEPSRYAPRDFDAVGEYLKRELQFHGEDPNRADIRAWLQLADDDLTGATATIDAALKVQPDNISLRVLKGRILRYEGKLEEALIVLRGLSPLQMEEEGEWVAFINTLALAGYKEEALQRAEAALNDPAFKEADALIQSELLVALSDALVMLGRYSAAAAAIDDANALSGARNGHMLRKARIAYMEGDRYGAIVSLRRLMEVYPLNGVPFWLYGTLVEQQDQETYQQDMAYALQRLHPGDQPWDFVGAGLSLIGDKAGAKKAFQEGYQRDCMDLEGSDRANCDAWYWALARERLEEANVRIQEALADDPRNSSYLDTAAVVAWARGDKAGAIEAARKAALLSPEDPYLLWQLSRLESL
jgi:tetratricopeptide (TPR) repeat protein